MKRWKWVCVGARKVRAVWPGRTFASGLARRRTCCGRGFQPIQPEGSFRSSAPSGEAPSASSVSPSAVGCCQHAQAPWLLCLAASRLWIQLLHLEPTGDVLYGAISHGHHHPSRDARRLLPPSLSLGPYRSMRDVLAHELSCILLVRQHVLLRGRLPPAVGVRRGQSELLRAPRRARGSSL